MQKKILVLMFEDQIAIFDGLYEGMRAAADCEILSLTRNEQKNLKTFFKKIKLEEYERVIVFLRFKHLMKQINFLQTIPNLVFLETDACQNYIQGKYFGKFTKTYKQVPWCRVICTGAGVAQKMQSEGIDAVFVPKGYDQTFLSNVNLTRDIELGFIGSINNQTYSKRKAFLETISDEKGLMIMKTKPGKDYHNTLNRIQYFVSADVGLHEYMIKNFEAMACGCVVFAYDQGRTESDALGFVDMENIVLYRTEDEFSEKLDIVRSNQCLSKSIAESGQRLAEEKYSFAKIGKKVIFEALKPLRPYKKLSFIDKLKLRFFGVEG